MKKLLILFLCCVFALSGCGTEMETQLPAQTIPLPVSTFTTEPNPEETTLYAVSVPAIKETYETEDGTALFSYTAQHMQLILPNEDIADNIILDFLNRVDASSENADNVLSAARLDYDPEEMWLPYYYQIIYSPMRIDPGVLSLFGSQSSYSGGMHGSISCMAANYDLTTGDVLTLGSIMHMNASKEDFIVRIIDKLNTLTAQYDLYDDFEEAVYARLSGDENLYEDFYFTQTGLCFYFAPYEIAPYASGIIHVEIPYTELPGLIYDGYFPAERECVEGSMRATDFMQTDMEQFQNMAEVTLVNGEEIMAVYPEGRVEDIRITVAGDGFNRPEYIIFAAFEMSDENAVVLSLSKEDIAEMTISYMTNGKIQSFPMG